MFFCQLTFLKVKVSALVLVSTGSSGSGDLTEFPFLNAQVERVIQLASLHRSYLSSTSVIFITALRFANSRILRRENDPSTCRTATLSNGLSLSALRGSGWQCKYQQIPWRALGVTASACRDSVELERGYDLLSFPGTRKIVFGA